MERDDASEPQQCTEMAGVRTSRKGTRAVEYDALYTGSSACLRLVGEICEALRGVFGQYQVSSVLQAVA